MQPSDAVLNAVAWPGEAPRSRILPAAVAGLVGVAVGPRAALWELAAAGVAPLAELVKRAVGRPRPMPGRFNPLGGMSQAPSFPSSHASDYVAVFGFASWLLWRRGSQVAGQATLLALGFIGLVGPSRVRTGDHRWSDVVGGYALGGAYLAALIAAARRDRQLAAHRPVQDVVVAPEAPAVETHWDPADERGAEAARTAPRAPSRWLAVAPLASHGATE
jgi:membrane-associated phospholipid phosphatase